MYGLLAFRLAAVDQRLPLIGGALLAVVGSLDSLPDAGRRGVLFVTPLALAWLLRLTVYHARSKEDVLRRIDEIERHVNQIAGEELLLFQSRHPSRARTTAGRSGMGTVLSVLWFCAAGLLGCLALIANQRNSEPHVLVGYAAYVSIVAVDLVHVVIRLRRYRYAKAPADGILVVHARRHTGSS